MYMTEQLDHWGIINRLFGPLAVEYCFLFDILSKVGLLGTIIIAFTVLYNLWLGNLSENKIYLILAGFIFVHWGLMYFVNRLLHGMCVHAFTEGMTDAGIDASGVAMPMAAPSVTPSTTPSVTPSVTPSTTPTTTALPSATLKPTTFVPDSSANTTAPVQITYTPKPTSNTPQPCGFNVVPNTYLQSAYTHLNNYDISNATASINQEINRRNAYINRLQNGTSQEVVSFNTGIINQLEGVLADFKSDKINIADDMYKICNIKLSQ
jgi:hypothetical protein